MIVYNAMCAFQMCIWTFTNIPLNILYHNTELDEYIGCFVEDGPEACEGEINVRMIYVYLYVLTYVPTVGNM